MSFRHILVPLLGHDGDRPALEAALVLARHDGGHIAALHIKADPLEAMPLMVDVGIAATQLVEAAERHADTGAQRAHDTFTAWQTENAIPIGESLADTHTLSTALQIVSGETEDALPRLGRLTDLIVIGRPTGEDAADQALARTEDALFGAGRPVLLVPAGVDRACLDSLATGPAMIAWNGSIESTRAMTAALDLLRDFKTVRVVSVKEGRKDHHPAEDLVRYLGWQGIAATVTEVPEGHGAAERVLASAREQGCGLIVMGAYSHGRLRQLVLGGVTSLMIETAEMPVLMAH